MFEGYNKEEAFEEYEKQHPYLVVDLSSPISSVYIFKHTPYILCEFVMTRGTIETYKITKVSFQRTQWVDDDTLYFYFKSDEGSYMYFKQ